MKSISEFHKNKGEKDGYQRDCKSCHSKYQRNYRKNPMNHQKEKDRKNNLKKCYGMTIEQFEKILDGQNRRCAICGTKTPKGKGNFHVDHDHRTKRFRGLLCNSCNQMIGRAYENPMILFSAIRYLRETKKAKLKAFR